LHYCSSAFRFSGFCALQGVPNPQRDAYMQNI
jgi:hypothetical protein